MKKSCLILSVLFVLAGCGRSEMNSLKSIERSMEKNPYQAIERLDSIDSNNLCGKRLAIYSMLKTQAYHLAGKVIESDSVARIATDYWGIRKIGHYPAMSWYSLGCAYSDMNKDPEAIYALLKAKELFPDTISKYYASTLSMLGHHYNLCGLHDEAIRSYTESKQLYEKLDDCRNASLAELNVGISLYGKEEYNKAQAIFERVLDDKCIDTEGYRTCLLYMAHVKNGIYNVEAGSMIFEYINPYLRLCKNNEQAAPGYALKGIAFYYIHNLDSAFYYLRRAHSSTNDLDTRILAVEGLEKVAIQLRNYQAAWNQQILNEEYQNERKKQVSQSEITQIRLQHSDAMQKQKIRSRVVRVIFVGSLVLTIVLASLIIISIQRDRRRETYYLNKYDDLIKKQIEEKSNSQGNRLMEACDAFRTGIAFNLVNDVAMQHRSFRQEERDVVIHDINLYFASPIANLRAEAGKLGQQDITLIFCNLLGIDQDLVADIMCTSRSNMRSIKSRLRAKISADTFALYFKD